MLVNMQNIGVVLEKASRSQYAGVEAMIIVSIVGAKLPDLPHMAFGSLKTFGNGMVRIPTCSERRHWRELVSNDEHCTHT